MLRAFYRTLLRACPPRVRRELGAEMEDVFMHCLDVARRRGGWLGGSFGVGRGVIDLLAFAAASRLDEREGPRPVPGPESGRRSSFMFRRHEFNSAWRQMRQRPFGSGAIIFMLALGLGASTAMFSVVYGVLLRPLPF